MYRIEIPEIETRPIPAEDDKDQLWAEDGQESVQKRVPVTLPAGKLVVWNHAEGKRFLAEWPNRVAVLRKDGLVALIRPDDRTGRAAELLQVSPDAEGLSNPYNDAIILTTPGGHLWCMRPVGAPALTLDDFRSSAPHADGEQPTAEPPSEKPAAEKSEPGVLTTDELLLTDPLRSEKPLTP